MILTPEQKQEIARAFGYANDGAFEEAAALGALWAASICFGEQERHRRESYPGYALSAKECGKAIIAEVDKQRTGSAA